MDLQGKDGNELRNYYQTILNLAPAEAASIKQYAATCVMSIQQLDQQAQTIVQQIRAAYPTGAILSSNTVPPADPRLVQLTGQRDAVTNTAIANLQAALSSTTFQKLDTYIRTQFARQVSSVPIVYHPPSGASLGEAAGGAK